MKIVASTLHLDAVHQREEHFSQSTALRAWRNAPQAATTQDGAQNAQATPPKPNVHISEAGRNAQTHDAAALEDAAEAARNDPKLSLIRAVIALLIGKDPLTLTTADLAPPADNTAGETPPPATDGSSTTPTPPAGWGVDFSQSTHYSESETVSFSAAGVIRTADGQEIRFDLSLSLQRTFSFDSETSLKLGDAARQKKDPLILNFAGPAAQLTSQRFTFDLNADGKSEQIHFATGGSGFLALDRNGNGKIDNGSELFGAHSGNGFADLAGLDSDGNGWIDENDPAYAQLRVLNKSADGQDHLSTLAAAGVGAIALDHVGTPFDLYAAQHDLQGQIRSSGVFLREDGTAGTVQQVDLTV